MINLKIHYGKWELQKLSARFINLKTNENY